MATTTNYGWTTPDNTDLVKDGALAIRTLGSAVDATVFANAGASIAKTIVDAKGDIIAATAADTVARLAVGANDTVLTADSTTATGLKWATPAGGGGYTLLSTTALSGASTSISITPTGYTALMISIEGPDLAADDGFSMNINNDSKTNLALVRYDSGAASTSGSKNGFINFNNGTDMDSSTHMAAGVLWIYNPTSTTVSKAVDFRVTWLDGTGGTNWASYIGGGAYTGSSVASINFASFGSSFAGGSVLVYGVK